MELVPNTSRWGRIFRRQIACLRRAGKPGRPRRGFVFGGFKSDMHGTKAEHLDHFAAPAGRAYLRFDYSAHGLFKGRFDAGTIGTWLEESLAVIRDFSAGPQIPLDRRWSAGCLPRGPCTKAAKRG